MDNLLLYVRLNSTLSINNYFVPCVKFVCIKRLHNIHKTDNLMNNQVTFIQILAKASYNRILFIKKIN